jgi:hypothetical protein
MRQHCIRIFYQGEREMLQLPKFERAFVYVRMGAMSALVITWVRAAEWTVCDSGMH